jgi:gas vesicle structural protein
MPIAG